MLRQPNADGFAQIIVLTGLAILGGIIATLQMQMIGAIHTQSALKQTVIGRIAAESATRRVFAAIVSDDDTLEQALLAETGTHQLKEAGLNVALSLEDEAGKISANRPNVELVHSYLLNLGIDKTFGESSPSSRDLRAAVSVGLIEQSINAKFEDDFSRYHSSVTVDPQKASPRVIGALQNPPRAPSSSPPSIWTLSAKLGQIGPFRAVFNITSGNKVQLLGSE
jgi:hypothetical protein